jgi:hypothetical protein
MLQRGLPYARAAHLSTSALSTDDPASTQIAETTVVLGVRMGHGQAMPSQAPPQIRAKVFPHGPWRV